MGIYFLDSSALVKRYVSETGSPWVIQQLDPMLQHDAFIAAIASVEIIAAISRRARSGSLTTQAATQICSQIKADLQTDFEIIQITDTVIGAAMVFAQTYQLRGYDAVQLAAAAAVNQLCIANHLAPVIFVSADNELNAAAALEGLTIENPNDYP
jgi:uncharacterized protein